MRHTSTAVNVWDAGPVNTTPLPLPDLLGCCGGLVLGAAMSSADAERLAAVLKALAEPTRLRLVSLIAAHPDGEACVCELTDPIELTQPTVSHHLKVLIDAGLLQREQRGRWAYYRLMPGALDALAGLLTATAGR